jgi:glycerol-3-phosphate acyltransferase PlsY
VITLLLSVLAFLLGSVPTGQIIAARRGIDLRQTGSGNIGATNVLRTTGKGAALLTLAGDLLKGTAAVALARYFAPGILSEGIVGICAVLGHDFSLFLGFKGGKGVATGIGVLCLYSPQTGLVTIIIWLMTVLITRYSSLAALTAFAFLPLAIGFLDSGEKIPVALVISLLIFFKHRENLIRLLKGVEPRVGGRK